VYRFKAGADAFQYSGEQSPGIYIHIPFCEQRCYYCAFTVAVSPEEAYEPYVNRLIREIKLSGWNQRPETIFFGGGTPSILHGELIGRILANLPSGATELSLEANPGTLDCEKLRTYRDLGINRISLGVQSFHDEDLKFAGRLHRASDSIADFELLRRSGFDNVNVDLIAGLPDQRIDLWRENLHWVERLAPEHVSIYMLELEERSSWSKRTPAVPDDDFVLFYQTACEHLEVIGYKHYEISNWARPGHECRHNLKYWTGVSYRGFGVGAHSFESGSRFWNTASRAEYGERLDADELPIADREVLTSEMRFEEAIMLGLRQMKGFDVRALAEDLGIQYSSEWIERVRTLDDAGLVHFDGNILKLTPAGWLVANGVTEELL